MERVPPAVLRTVGGLKHGSRERMFFCSSASCGQAGCPPAQEPRAMWPFQRKPQRFHLQQRAESSSGILRMFQASRQLPTGPLQPGPDAGQPYIGDELPVEAQPAQTKSCVLCKRERSLSSISLNTDWSVELWMLAQGCLNHGSKRQSCLSRGTGPNKRSQKAVPLTQEEPEKFLSAY